jgi:hypothetical protein
MQSDMMQAAARLDAARVSLNNGMTGDALQVTALKAYLTVKATRIP